MKLEKINYIPCFDSISCYIFMASTSSIEYAKIKALEASLVAMSRSYKKYRRKVEKLMRMKHKVWKSKRVKKIRRMQVGGRSCK